MSKQKRIIVGKMGLDAHDNGLRIIAKWLADGGYEVVYAGLYNSPERIVQMAAEEHVDVIGISFLGGEHLHYSEELIQKLKDAGMADTKVVVGGVIPPDDLHTLKNAGVSATFTPGTTRQKILETMDGLFN